MYKNYLKIILDFIFALLGFILFMPFFLIVMIGLTLANHGNPFFFQNRPGKNGKIFKIVKFKTMTNEKDSDGKLLSDEKRLTKIGSFVRKTSLDEIPQLINVLKGDMSLIGPRPLLTDYLHLYNDFQNRRHEVKPGITGWAQVNYSYGETIDDSLIKLQYDLYYIKHRSIYLDLNIIVKTISTVLFYKGQ